MLLLAIPKTRPKIVSLVKNNFSINICSVKVADPKKIGDRERRFFRREKWLLDVREKSMQPTLIQLEIELKKVESSVL